MAGNGTFKSAAVQLTYLSFNKTYCSVAVYGTAVTTAEYLESLTFTNAAACYVDGGVALNAGIGSVSAAEYAQRGTEYIVQLVDLVVLT